MTRPTGRKPSTASSIGTQLPNDLPAEVAVLGSLILAGPGEVFHEIQSAVQAQDFYRLGHVSIYNAIGELYAQGEPVDLVTLQGKLADSDMLKEVGGIDGLLAVAESVPQPLDGPVYARRVHDLARLRGLIEAAYRIDRDARDNPSDAQAVIDRAQAEIFGIGQQSERRGAQQVGAGVDALLERLERGEPGAPGITTGFADLDHLVAGFHAGQMVVLAARPSMGKTALALNVAVDVAQRGRPVLFMSLEMAGDELRNRVLASQSGVTSDRMAAGEQFCAIALKNLREAASALKRLPLHVDDQRGLTIQQLRARVRREVARHHIELVVVDHLQLLTCPGQENRTQEITQISLGIKALAGELEVPILVLSQLNRQLEQREGHRPRLGDLRDSGAIEQDADVVLLLHRDDYYREGKERHDGLAEVNVAKHRNGRIGVAELRFEPELTRFTSLPKGVE